MIIVFFKPLILQPEAIIGERSKVWRHTGQWWEGWEAVHAEISFKCNLNLNAYIYFVFNYLTLNAFIHIVLFA